MNLVDAEVRGGRVHAVGLELPLPRGAAARDGTVIAGIRPTDLVADPEGRRRGCARSSRSWSGWARRAT